MIQPYIQQHLAARFSQALVISAFVLLATSPAHADSRNEARSAVDQLQHSEIAREKTDDMGSIEATFSAAEQYLQQNNREMAERYYLLTIQKTRILKSSLAVPQEIRNQVLPFQSLTKLQIDGPTPAPEADSLSKPTDKGTSAVKPVTDQEEESLQSTAEITPTLKSNPDDEPITSTALVGNANTYSVVKNDTLRLIAAKLGVSRQHLVQLNNLDQKTMLKIGQKLKYNNRKIVPQRMNNGIVINIPDRTLYFFNKGRLEAYLPVALGVPKKSAKFDWTTPTGKFKITAKQKDPTWHVPQSIRSEMEEDGKEIVTSMPPGPTNPLGKYAFKTSLPGILIHSTTKPGSIYSFASHGCVRVYPEHMEEFFRKVRLNTPGEIIYRPVKLAITENGRVFLEVHRDAYGKSTGLHAMAMQLIEKHNLSKRVDWNKVESVIRHKAGLAEDITL